MRRRDRSVGNVAVALLMLLLVGCDGSDAQVEIAVGLGVRAAAAYCEAQSRCCDAEEIGTIEDTASCRLFDVASFEGSAMPSYREAVAAGRMRFDVAAFERCIARLETEDCGRFAARFRARKWDVLWGCDGVITGLVDSGEPCRLSGECASRYCEPTINRCVPMPRVDEPCPDGWCGAALYCDPVFERCRPTLSDGTACTRHSECDTGNCTGTCTGWCTGGGTEDMSFVPELEELVLAEIAAECDGLDRCCNASERAERAGDRATEGAGPIECRRRAALTAASFADVRYRAAREGRGTIDAGRVAECHAFVTSEIACAAYAEAQPVSDLREACRTWFAGNLTCTRDSDCGAGGLCSSYYFGDQLVGDCYGGSGGSWEGVRCSRDQDCGFGACVGEHDGLLGECTAICQGGE